MKLFHKVVTSEMNFCWKKQIAECLESFEISFKLLFVQRSLFICLVSTQILLLVLSCYSSNYFSSTNKSLFISIAEDKYLTSVEPNDRNHFYVTKVQTSSDINSLTLHKHSAISAEVKQQSKFQFL